MAHFFPAGRPISTGQIFRNAIAATSNRPQYLHYPHSDYDDHPTNIPPPPCGVIPGRGQRAQARGSDQPPPPALANRPSLNQGSLPAPSTRPRSKKLFVQVFDESTTVTQIRQNRLKYRKENVRSSTTVRRLIEKLGGGRGSIILVFREANDGELEQKDRIQYGRDEEEFWTMEMMGWGMPRDSAEQGRVVLVLEK